MHVLKYDCLNSCYTPNSLCIAHFCILRPQRTMDVTNLYIVACQDSKALWSNIGSMAKTLKSLSHNRHLQCYLKIRYIHGAFLSFLSVPVSTIDYDNPFEIAVYNSNCRPSKR